MEKRFLCNTIQIRDENMYPLYIPDSGIVKDKHSGKTMSRLRYLEMSNYFYFKFEFAGYTYIDHYQIPTGGYKQKMFYRLYNMVLYINIDNVVKAKRFVKENIMERLSFYLTRIVKMSIRKKKVYTTKSTEIAEFIAQRNSEKMFLLPWDHFILDETYTVDLLKQKIFPRRDEHKILFERFGGIIETNDVIRLLKENFNVRNKKTLVVMPANMTNIWNGANVSILKYEDFARPRLSSSSVLKQIKKMVEPFKQIKQVIIHECHMQFLPWLKKFINELPRCETIWVINSLPLRYYFSMKTTPKKLNLDHLKTITNLWLNMNTTGQKKLRTEIIKFLLTDFNKIYTTVHYDSPGITNISKLQLVPAEKTIRDEITKRYAIWKNNLTDDLNNSSSFSTKEKNNSLEIKFFDTTLLLIFSIMAGDQTQNFFRVKISPIISAIISKNDKLTELEACCRGVTRLSRAGRSFPKESLESDPCLKEIKKEHDRLDQMLNKYRKYSDENSTFDDGICPICYSSDDFVKTKLICGHCICLECILNALSSSNKCPICNEFSTINTLAIIKETIPNYQSNIINYFDCLPRSTLIITNLNAVVNLQLIHPELRIININKENISDKIKKMHKLELIILFVAPTKMLDRQTSTELSQIVGFFNMFNEKPNFVKIDIVD